MISARSLINRDKRLSQAAASKLARSPEYAQLEVIDLWGNRLSAKALASLLKTPPPGLRELQIVDNGLGPAGAEVLAAALPQLERLELLNLRHNGLGAEGLAPVLAALPPKLRSLGLRENKLGLAGAQQLGACSHATLEVLHIGDNELGDAGMQALAPLLPGLVELRCGDNDLGVDAMQVIATGARLEQLDLERNWCGPEAAAALAELRAPLRRLDLYWNDIGPAGARALFEGREYAQLEELQLRANKLGDGGASALAGATMPKLERLSIEDNAIGTAGAQALASASMMGCLQRVNLHGNRFEPAGISALLRSQSLPKAARTDATLILQHYLDDGQIAALALAAGVEAGASKRET